MSTLTLKNVPDDLVKELKAIASAEDRSLNQQAIHLLRKAVAASDRTEGNVARQVAEWDKLSRRFKTVGFPQTARVLEGRRSGRRKQKAF